MLWGVEATFACVGDVGLDGVVAVVLGVVTTLVELKVVCFEDELALVVVAELVLVGFVDVAAVAELEPMGFVDVAVVAGVDVDIAFDDAAFVLVLDTALAGFVGVVLAPTAGVARVVDV